jgi:hypothetical protein
MGRDGAACLREGYPARTEGARRELLEFLQKEWIDVLSGGSEDDPGICRAWRLSDLVAFDFVDLEFIPNGSLIRGPRPTR